MIILGASWGFLRRHNDDYTPRQWYQSKFLLMSRQYFWRECWTFRLDLFIYYYKTYKYKVTNHKKQNTAVAIRSKVASSVFDIPCNAPVDVNGTGDVLTSLPFSCWPGHHIYFDFMYYLMKSKSIWVSKYRFSPVRILFLKFIFHYNYCLIMPLTQCGW